MKHRGLLIAALLLGVLVGPAAAAFVSSTSNSGNTFSTRSIASVPVIGATRITTDPGCGPAIPAETIRQGASFYVCVESVTDTAGIATVSANVSSINGDDVAPLSSSGGPWGGYAWRSGALTAGVPLPTGANGTYAVQATNGDGNRKTEGGLLYNVRSYDGWLRGEFGTPPVSANLQQYYSLSELTGTGPNRGAGTYPLTYNGAPTRGVAGALIGSSDAAARINGGTDYLSATRRVQDDLTLSIWIRGHSGSGAGPGTVWLDAAGLMSSQATGTATFPDRDYGIGLDATGRVVAGCGRSTPSTGAVTLRSAAGLLDDGDWHHVVFTRARTALAIRLYVDGSEVASAANCSNASLNQAAQLWIGRGQESGLSVDAELDEATTHSRVLSPAEVAELYALGTGT